tara:strand:- start:1032 stop:2819 length:1788 start_codon:yes stop_codon:yes gene_type:complete
MEIKKRKVFFDLNYFIKVFELISLLNRSTKKKFIFIIFAMLINSLLEFITIGSMIPFITFVSNPDKISEIKILKVFSDFFNIESTEQLFLIVCVLFLLIIFLSGFIKILNVKIINDFGATLKVELGRKLYRNIIYQDYQFHLNTNSSHLISSQINHLDSSISLISELMRLCLSVLTSIGIILSLIVIDAKIVLFTVIISFIFYLTASISTKKYNDFYGKIIFESRTIIIKVIQESLGFIRQIILDDSYKLFIDEYDQNNKKNSIAGSNSITIGQIPRYLMEVLVLSVLVIAIAFIFLTRADFYGYITIFGAFILGLQKLLPLFQKTFGSIYIIRQEKFSLNLIVNLLKETNNLSTIDNNKKVNILNLRKNIRLENIHYSYKDNKVLENINIEIKKGDVIGIVGKTGAGKSTFIDLLLGLIKPTSGNIYLDDKEMDLKLFRRFRLSVSSVPQDYFLLDRSIEENIVFGKSYIDNNLLNKVVNISMLREFIKSQRNGLKTFVGEDGIRLSGGQKQRVAIARALYKKHSFLILDEATSSVDLETEKNILNNIVKDNPNLTVIMIAHRLQTLEKCNYILEIKNKKIIKHKNIKEYRSKY